MVQRSHAIALVTILVLLSTTLPCPAAASATPRLDATTTAAIDQVATKEKSSPKAWSLAIFVAVLIVAVIIKNILWPVETRPMTPQEIKESPERLLDGISQINMWQAVARNDGDALREEMKLMELRNLRRLNE